MLKLRISRAAVPASAIALALAMLLHVTPTECLAQATYGPFMVEPARVGNDEQPLGLSPPSENAALAPPDAGDSPSTAGGVMTRTAISLAVVLALIFAMAALARRFINPGTGLAGSLGRRGRAPSGLLEIIGRYPLSRAQSLVLLRMDRRILLVSLPQPRLSLRGSGGEGPRTLCEFSDPEDVASILVKARDSEGESASATFRTLLGSFSARQPGEVDRPQAPDHSVLEHDGTDAPSSSLADRPDTIMFSGAASRLGAPDPAGDLRRRLAAYRSREKAGAGA